MNTDVLNFINPNSFKDAGTALSYMSAKILDSIGKLDLWRQWHKEEVFVATKDAREKYWQEKYTQCLAAQKTHSLTPEELQEYSIKVMSLKLQTAWLAKEANCGSPMFWDLLLYSEHFCADPALYWQEQLMHFHCMVMKEKNIILA